jgi:heat shock protein HtpX
MIIVAPIAAMLIQLAISRSREYQADASAAELTGKPLALAAALGRLEQGADYLPMDAQPATAHMFTVSPLRGGGLMGLFSTHPPIEKRIERLQRMAAG